MTTQPSLIFGAGFLGVSFPSSHETASLLHFLQRHRINHIDTARRYPAIKPGRSEQLLGEAHAAALGFVIDTKIKVTSEQGPKGSLTAVKIRESIVESFEALGVQQVNVLHVHMPDPETPIEETAAAFDEAYRKGYFKKLGLANYTAAEIDAWMHICTSAGYVKPTVYQGQYNMLCRRPEEDLFPTLRRHGIVFNAYSPLAGGFLTGLPTFGPEFNSSTTTTTPKSPDITTTPISLDTTTPTPTTTTTTPKSPNANTKTTIPTSTLNPPIPTPQIPTPAPTPPTTATRFHPSNPMGTAHQRWYDTPTMHAAIRHLHSRLQPLNMTIMEVSLRWLVWHSALRGDGDVEGNSDGNGNSNSASDGIIVGGSTVQQLEGVLGCLGFFDQEGGKGRVGMELPSEVLRAVDEVWEIVRGEAPGL